MTAPTDDELQAAARALVPTLNVLAGQTVVLPPARTWPVPNPCLSCRRPGTLNLIILGPNGASPPTLARVMFCKVHRDYLTAALADTTEPLQLEGRDILAINPTPITLGAKR